MQPVVHYPERLVLRVLKPEKEAVEDLLQTEHNPCLEREPDERGILREVCALHTGKQAETDLETRLGSVENPGLLRLVRPFERH